MTYLSIVVFKKYECTNLIIAELQGFCKEQSVAQNPAISLNENSKVLGFKGTFPNFGTKQNSARQTSSN
jgi:hypothetical protein